MDKRSAILTVAPWVVGNGSGHAMPTTTTTWSWKQPWHSGINVEKPDLHVEPKS